MSWWKRVTALLKSEAAYARDELDDAAGRLNQDLDMKEAEMASSPEERLKASMAAIEEDNAAFEALSEEIEQQATERGNDTP